MGKTQTICYNRWPINGACLHFYVELYKVDGVEYNFWYFFLWSLVFYIGLTIFSVPYVAMGYEMSDDFHERTNIMAISQWIGQWAWVIAPLFGSSCMTRVVSICRCSRARVSDLGGHTMCPLCYCTRYIYKE